MRDRRICKGAVIALLVSLTTSVGVAETVRAVLLVERGCIVPSHT